MGMHGIRSLGVDHWLHGRYGHFTELASFTGTICAPMHIKGGLLGLYLRMSGCDKGTTRLYSTQSILLGLHGRGLSMGQSPTLAMKQCFGVGMLATDAALTCKLSVGLACRHAYPLRAAIALAPRLASASKNHYQIIAYIVGHYLIVPARVLSLRVIRP